MEYFLESVVDDGILQEARRSYEESVRQGIPNEQAQLEYAKCLVRCRSYSDIKHGILLLNDLMEGTVLTQTTQKCLLYLGVGYARMEEYKTALEYTERLLRLAPNHQYGKELKEYLDKKFAKDLLIGTGLVVGGAALLAGGIYGLVKLGQHFLSDKKEVPGSLQGARDASFVLPEPRRTPIIDEVSSSGSDEEEGMACSLRDVHIGGEFNQWVRGVANYGECDSRWLEELKASQYVGEIDCERRQWDRSCRAVDKVLKLLLDELRGLAENQYRELKIDSFILQGSARDGLKVIAPDEFDVGFEFHIEGIHLEECSIKKDGGCIPGFCYLKVSESESKIQKKCPTLWKIGVFIKNEDGCFLSSKILHGVVFQSLVDKSIQRVEKNIRDDGGLDFSIKRKYNPPAVNISIHLNNEDLSYFQSQPSKKAVKFTGPIDVDIIPALRLKIDSCTQYCGRYINAPIHAICKWREEESAKALEIADQSLVWLLNSVAYERFIFDVARNCIKQQYILTALRILKTYMTKVRSILTTPPPQVSTVLQSYHLKQITCYLIMYTCFVHPDIQIEGAQSALILLVCLLEECLDTGILPHFFYSNSMIDEMFSNYPEEGKVRYHLRFNMLRKLSTEAKLQALLSLRGKMSSDLGLPSNGGKCSEYISRLKSAYRTEVSLGEYF